MLTSADVEATSAAQVTPDKGSLHVVIPTGTESTIDCWVYDDAPPERVEIVVGAHAARQVDRAEVTAPVEGVLRQRTSWRHSGRRATSAPRSQT